MPRLPAACASCGALYPSPLRARGGESDTAFEVPVPCPECGSGGRVPAEVLQRLAGLVRTLEETDPGEERLEAFLEGVERVCRKADDREEAVLEGLRVDPGLGRLAGGLPGGTPELMEAFLPLLRRLATAVREGARPPEGESGDGHALAVVEHVLEELYEARSEEREEAGEPEEVVRARGRLDRTGRNDPCPCGSGRKYKDCHWTEDLRLTRG